MYNQQERAFKGQCLQVMKLGYPCSACMRKGSVHLSVLWRQWTQWLLSLQWHLRTSSKALIAAVEVTARYTGFKQSLLCHDSVHAGM